MILTTIKATYHVLAAIIGILGGDFEYHMSWLEANDQKFNGLAVSVCSVSVVIVALIVGAFAIGYGIHRIA